MHLKPRALNKFTGTHSSCPSATLGLAMYQAVYACQLKPWSKMPSCWDYWATAEKQKWECVRTAYGRTGYPFQSAATLILPLGMTRLYLRRNRLSWSMPKRFHGDGSWMIEDSWEGIQAREWGHVSCSQIDILGSYIEEELNILSHGAYLMRLGMWWLNVHKSILIHAFRSSTSLLYLLQKSMTSTASPFILYLV